MPNKLRVGLVGHGKAGQAVANVLSNDPRFELRWIARRSVAGPLSNSKWVMLHSRQPMRHDCTFIL